MVARSKLGKKRRGNRPATRREAMSEDESLAEELLRVSREEQADFVAGWKKFMKQLGIRGKPISAKKLRAMALKEGINPGDNQFSRGIIDMREE